VTSSPALHEALSDAISVVAEFMVSDFITGLELK
jgi:hypothetical protein